MKVISFETAMQEKNDKLPQLFLEQRARNPDREELFAT
jgi:hypothetical protein